MAELTPLVRADFNGLFGDVLCLTHNEWAIDRQGHRVALAEGMSVIAFDDDVDDEDRPAYLIASGTVSRPPAWLDHTGSRWVLGIDADGVQHVSELPEASPAVQPGLSRERGGEANGGHKIRATWNRTFPGGHILAFAGHSHVIEFGSDRKPPLVSIGWCRWYPCSLDFPRWRRL